MVLLACQVYLCIYNNKLVSMIILQMDYIKKNGKMCDNSSNMRENTKAKVYEDFHISHPD